MPARMVPLGGRVEPWATEPSGEWDSTACRPSWRHEPPGPARIARRSSRLLLRAGFEPPSQDPAPKAARERQHRPLRSDEGPEPAPTRVRDNPLVPLRGRVEPQLNRSRDWASVRVTACPSLSEGQSATSNLKSQIRNCAPPHLKNRIASIVLSPQSRSSPALRARASRSPRPLDCPREDRASRGGLCCLRSRSPLRPASPHAPLPLAAIQ
jgi:hypothetical protein